MLKRFKTILQQSTLLKVSSFNAVSVIIKMITGLGVSKLSAIYIGPQGLAVLGNLRNAIEVFDKFSSGGLTNGVIKYSAENKSDPKAFSGFLSTLVWFGLVMCFLTVTLILLFSDFINTLIFGARDFKEVIHIASFVLPLHVINIYMMSILKGFGEFNKIIKINIASHLLNIIVFATLIYTIGLKGALLAIIIVPTAMLGFTLYYAQSWFGVLTAFRFHQFSKPMLGNLGEFAFMTLISGLSFPLVFLGIRTFLIDHLGEDQAGFWESMVRISTYYLMFVLTVLNLFILPKLAESKTIAEFRTIVFSFYKQILPLFISGLILVYWFREWIIRLVFTREFLPAADLFFWQMTGDFFRVLAMVMVYQFHAKKMLWHYIFTDLFLALSLYFSALYFVPRIGLEGVVLGHAMTYIVYFLLILFIFRKTLIFYKR